jgi:hypothetical protein
MPGTGLPYSVGTRIGDIQAQPGVMTHRVTRFTCTKVDWPWHSPDVAHARVT